MTDKKYKSKIEFHDEDNSLEVEINYERTFNKEDEELARNYFYWRAKKRGDKVKREDISVSPKAGGRVKETTTFGVWLDRELYLGLERVKREAPYVFPLLIEDLRKYSSENSDKKELVDYTIKGLKELFVK